MGNPPPFRVKLWAPLVDGESRCYRDGFIGVHILRCRTESERVVSHLILQFCAKNPFSQKPASEWTTWVCVCACAVCFLCRGTREFYYLPPCSVVRHKVSTICKTEDPPRTRGVILSAYLHDAKFCAVAWDGQFLLFTPYLDWPHSHAPARSQCCLCVGVGKNGKLIDNGPAGWSVRSLALVRHRHMTSWKSGQPRIGDFEV